MLSHQVFSSVFYFAHGNFLNCTTNPHSFATRYHRACIFHFRHDLLILIVMATHTTLSSSKWIISPLKPRILENFRKQNQLNCSLSGSEHDYSWGLRNPSTISDSSFIPLPSKIPRPTRTDGRSVNELFPSHSQSFTSILSPFRNESDPFVVNKISVCHENSIMNIDKSPVLNPSFKNDNTKSHRPFQNLFFNDAKQIVFSYFLISLTE